MLFRKIKLLSLILTVSLPLCSMEIVGSDADDKSSDSDTEEYKDEEDPDDLADIVDVLSMEEEPKYPVCREKFERAFCSIQLSCGLLASFVKGIKELLSEHKGKKLSEKEWQAKVDDACDQKVPVSAKKSRDFVIMKILLMWILGKGY